MNIVHGFSARECVRSGATESVLVLTEKTNNLCVNFVLANKFGIFYMRYKIFSLQFNILDESLLSLLTGSISTLK